MIYFILFVSFILDGIILSMTTINEVVIPLFSLLVLTIIFPYYQNKIKSLYIAAIVFGLLYDIVFMNSLFMNTLLFVANIWLTKQIFKNFTNNFFNMFVWINIIIIFYQFSVCLCYSVSDLINFNLQLLINNYIKSLIINYIFFIVSYFSLYNIFQNQHKSNIIKLVKK